MSHLIELQTIDTTKVKFNQNSIHFLMQKIAYKNQFYNQRVLNKFSRFQFQIKKVIFLTKNYQIKLKISLNEISFSLQTQLISKDSPVTISCRKMRLILERTLQKYQSKHSEKIYINNNGSINTQTYVNFSQQFCFSIMNKPKLAQIYILNQIQKFVKSAASFYKNILIKINFNKQQIIEIKPTFLQNFQRTKKICNSCLYLPLNKAIIQLNTYNLPSVQQTYFQAIHKNTWLYYFYNDSFCKTHQDLNYVLLILKNQANKSNRLSPSQYQRNQKTYLRNIKYRRQSQDFQQNKQFLFNQISILNMQSLNWQSFQCTSFSNLLKGKIKYQNLSLEASVEKKYNFYINQKTVILKYQSSQKRNTHLIRWEKQIIKHFTCKNCVFIPKYYNTQQNVLQYIVKRNNCSNKYQFLICEYIKRGNLKNWLAEVNAQSSICTRTNIVVYLLYGLNFIHDFNIIHLDLKPANILIDKNNVAKITDFGSSYNEQVYNKMKKEKIKYLLSFSIPYTPPQIFMKKKKPILSPKCDIYSLGIILFQIYFQRNILDFNLSMLTRLYYQLGRSLEDQNKGLYQILLQRIFVAPQKYQKEGLAQSMWCILNICLKCLNAQQQKRPSIQWIIIAVKQTYLNFIEFYNQ